MGGHGVDFFAKFDTDGDGKLSLEELQKALRDMGGQHVTLDELREALRVARACGNKDADADVTRKEFEAILDACCASEHCQAEATDEDLRALFEVFDEDRSGTIEEGELAHVLQLLGERVDDGRVHSELLRADTDGDGRIDFEEFKVYVRDLERRRHEHADAKRGSSKTKAGAAFGDLAKVATKAFFG